MERKDSERSDLLISAFAVALVAATMGLGAVVATKTNAEAESQGTQSESRETAGEYPGIAATAKPDDVQMYY